MNTLTTVIKAKLLLVNVLLLLGMLGISSQIVHAEVYISPAPETGVYDGGNFLDESVDDEVTRLNKIYAETKEKPQIAVFIVNTLGGETIESVSLEVARKWQIGYSDTNNGVLLAIAVDDRKFRIEASTNASKNFLSDREASRILDDSEVVSLMREENYTGAVLRIISKIDEQIQGVNSEENSSPKHLVIGPSSQSDVELTAEDTKLILFAVLFIGGLFSVPVVIFYLICAIIKKTTNYFEDKKEAKRREFLLNRSQYDYQGDDKLFPNDFLFIDNDSWTRELLDDFWHDLYLERSNYYYEGSDKLYPDNFDFIENKTWTKELTVAYYKEKEEKKKREEEAKLAVQRRDYEDRLKRSRHDYSGPRKLYPKDADFVKNDTWTETLLYAYIAQQAVAERVVESSTRSSHSSSHTHHNHDSSSSWDSSSWSGGGFDGGGASGSW